VVRYALSLPGRAELRFTPAAVGTAAVRMRVSVESLPGRERELWEASVDPRAVASSEVALPLPGVAGEAMRLSLRVDAAPQLVASALWKAPRVLGAAETPRASLEPRTRELRERLQGRSVVFVILDAARARQLSCYGYARATTPEIDRIAREGVVFENVTTPAVYTVGAMSSIWTSQPPDEHHGDTGFETPLPGDRLTLPELLSGHGVKTAGFVANAMAGRALGFARGFSEFHEVFGDPELRDPELGSRAELFRRVLPRWLAGRRSPFFLYVHFREPHFPYDPPAEFRTRFGPDAPLPPAASRERDWYLDVNRGNRRPSVAEIEHLVRLYDGNLAYVDREVGALRRALEDTGLLGDVLLVLAADHGEQLFEHGYISHSAQVYEESTRVPLILRLPGAAEAGRRISAQVDLLDVAPTIADMFGLLGEGGSDREFEGRTLWPVIAGAPGKRLAVSRSVWDRPLYAVRAGRHKLIRDTRSGEEHLYDAAADPREQSDRLSDDPLRAAALREDLFEWLGRLRRRPGGGAVAQLTIEQCENLRSLGYVSQCP
jgi:arylsulfatase A-like enzyme